jgi:alpha-L-fucosidase
LKIVKTPLVKKLFLWSVLMIPTFPEAQAEQKKYSGLEFPSTRSQRQPIPDPSRSVSSLQNETKSQRDARMGWWREAKFGLFIHWGVYAVPAGEYQGQPVPGRYVSPFSEWLMFNGQLPVAEYRKFARQFNPTAFDAEVWVKAAQDAGMRYIVITAKHHDGFAMFRTAVSDWNIVSGSPYGKDPLEALAAACRRHNMKLGFYYSQAQDWINGGAVGLASMGDKAPPRWDPAMKDDMDTYLDSISVPQIRELCSNYGEFPQILWWDTPRDMNPRRAAKILDAVRELRPDVMMNNRLGGGQKGDTETPEGFIPSEGYPGRDWETCMTMNNSWGYRKNDNAWKSTAKIIRNLCDIVSKGGNYLLNVGPDATGRIPAACLERMSDVGAWMKINGEAIYGTHTGPLTYDPVWGRVSRKGDRVFVYVFDWPTQGRLTVPFKGSVLTARLLSDPAVIVRYNEGKDGVLLELPAQAPDPHVSVVTLQVSGEVRGLPRPAQQAQGDGTLVLKAADARLTAKRLRLSGDDVPCLQMWVDTKDSAAWEIQVPQAGDYRVSLEYSCPAKEAGNTFQIDTSAKQLTGKIAATSGGTQFMEVDFGTLHFDAPGRYDLHISIIEKPIPGSAMSLRSIKLQPAK